MRKFENKTGYIAGQWPHPRPTGLDCYIAREAAGLSQIAMGYELSVGRKTIIKWERAGATMLIPHRPVAFWIDKMLGDMRPEKRKFDTSVKASMIRVDGNGDAT